MLETRRTITGESKIDIATPDGRTEIVAIEGYSATIDESNLNDVSFNSWPINSQLYKENRAQRRLDRVEFEDMVYAIQDKLIAERQAAEN